MLDRLQYVYEDMDRHGNVRIYVWRGKGHAKIRIRETPGTKEFRKAYEAAIEKAFAAAAEKPEESKPLDRTPKPGTYRWLCLRFMAESAAHKRDSARTRHVRKLVLESTFEERVAPDETAIYADFPLDRLTVKAMRVLRDRKIATPEAGNSRIKNLRKVFAWAIEEQIPGIAANLARDVPYFKSTSGGFHTWTLDEIEQYEARHPIGTKARLALALLLYTGVRRSDVVQLGRQMIRNGWLRFTEVKGKSRMVKERDIPLLPQLQAVIAATPGEHMTFLVTEFGAPFTDAGFGNWFRDRCNEAGLPRCTAHGLRKAGATIAAENGATEHQLMAIYGWESPKQAALYTRKANRKRLAGDAMHLVVPAKR
jgi:integrase